MLPSLRNRAGGIRHGSAVRAIDSEGMVSERGAVVYGDDALCWLRVS